MPFNKEFFEKLGGLLGVYFKIYPCGLVTLTIRAYDQEYNVVRILKCGDSLLTFAFYSSSPEKSH